MPCPFHRPWLGDHKYIWRRVQVTNLLKSKDTHCRIQIRSLAYIRDIFRYEQLMK
jgi:hypothetical protein